MDLSLECFATTAALRIVLSPGVLSSNRTVQSIASRLARSMAGGLFKRYESLAKG
jgi:hypothetical protein